MKWLIISSLVITCSAQAAIFNQYAKYTNDRQAYLWAGLGLSAGVLDGNVDYEHIYDEGFGVGGSLKVYNEQKLTTERGWSCSGFIRPHFSQKSWDFFITPGLGLSQYENSDDKLNLTLIIATFGTGIMLGVNQNVTVGVETTTEYNLFSDKVGSCIRNAFMFKARFSL
jgi:hypothetical protein